MAIDEREKNYSRSRTPSHPVFSRNYPFTLSTAKEKGKRSGRTFNLLFERSIVPLSSFPRTIHLVPRTFSKLKEVSMQMRHGIKSKFASHDSTWKLFYVARKSFRFEETTRYRSNEIQTLSYRSDIWKCLFFFRSDNTERRIIRMQMQGEAF